MILFLHGEDDFSVQRRRLALQKSFVVKHPQAEVSIFDFEDQSGPEDMRRALGACDSGLFANRKMVIFLHPLALEGQAGEMFSGFLKAWKQKESDVILLFVQTGKIKKTHPVVGFLLKQADKAEIFPKLDTKDFGALEKIIEKELLVISPAMKFSREALRMFMTAVGANRSRIVSELEKLVTYKGGEGIIEAEDVSLLLEDMRESVIFEALDMLGRGDRQRALLLLDSETDGGEGVYPVLAMCAWQARRMLIVREAYDQGMQRSGDIASQTKLAPFIVQKMLGTIAHFPLLRIKNGLVLLADFDTKLKTGAMDPQVALNLFVWKF